MTAQYLPFVDWLKVAGLALIVFDHVAHFMLPWRTPPFFPKQLGVAFFVFVTGYTLARERRPPLAVVAARWVPIWAWGLMFALLMSALGLVLFGDTNPSNYLPLLGGANVVLDAFPANPTTWYIGTYLHLLLLWALVLRNRRISLPLIGVFLALEIVARAVMSSTGGRLFAYQSVLNWLVVLACGLRYGAEERTPSGRAFWPALLLVGLWTLGVQQLAWSRDFPFAAPASWPGTGGWLLMAAAVSTGYLLHTMVAFHGLGQLPASAAVRFFARNTPLVFIGHMPIFYAMQATLGESLPPVWLAWLEFIAGFVGLAVISELLRPALQPHIDRLRQRLVGVATKLTKIEN